MANYITIDSGTTNTRICLVKNGKIIGFQKFEVGARKVIGNNEILKQTIKQGINEILKQNKMSSSDIEKILASGMITSEFGLVNLPHIETPAGAEDLHNNINETVIEDISAIPFVFIRGVKCQTENFENCDMMRGEETEIMGILKGEGTYILTGSHTKIINVDDKGKITNFKTMLTGEMLAALSENTILKDAVCLDEGELDSEYLLKGFDFCEQNGINNSLFKVRILKNMFSANASEIYSFFLGVVLHDEIKCILSQNAKRIIIGGKKQIKEALAIILKKLSSAEIEEISDEQAENASSLGLIKIYEYKRLEPKNMKVLSNENPKIIFTNREVFVDHQKNNRSGHLGHAMVECKDGSIIAFYSNCSGVSGIEFGGAGHSMYGWVEYKRSFDRGLTWGEAKVLKYSYDSFLDGVYKIGCEKAVVCDDGTIVLFCLRSIGKYFEPYATPVCLLSHDNGETWSEPISVSDERGRMYDAIYRNGRIYLLEFCNSTDKGFICAEEGKYYKIFASDDNGQSFYEYTTIPFNTMGHAYGNMIFRPDGSLIFYAYNADDEYNLTALESYDDGKTWGAPFKVRVAKIARNPQVGYVNGTYILHGRSEEGMNFVFYHSKDGINWDDGTIVNEGRIGGCYYSNNMTVKGADGKDRLLVQYSESYESAKTNIMHAWVEVE